VTLILCENVELVRQKAFSFEWRIFEVVLAGNGGKRDFGGITRPPAHAPQLVQDMLTPFSPKMLDTSSSVSKSKA
jgi:hypothetical protein